MRFLKAFAGMAVAALTLASAQAQTSPGVLVGVVRDTSGGVIPGARVSAQTGDSRQQTVSDAGGRYRFELPAGTYRIEVDLAGFRRTVVEAVSVTSVKEAQCDVTLRVGLLAIVDYVLPRSLAEVVPKADVVAHLRIVRNAATELVGNSLLAMEHAVVLLRVVKGGQFGIQPGPARLLQMNAGVWFEDGRRHTGQNAPYRPGDEFVALLRRDGDSRLHELLDRHLTFRVTAGTVTQQGGPINGFANGLTLESFLEVLRKLV